MELNLWVKKIIYIKDGVLHLKLLKEKIDNNWHLFLLGIYSKNIFERGTLYEIRYKMPVKESDVVYHINLTTKNQNGFNEQGWSFKQLFFGEILSNAPNQIRYCPSIWVGKKVGNKTFGFMDNAIADFNRENDKYTAYDTPYNMYDDNTNNYKMTNKKFYKWYTTTAVYDDERWAVYHDGIKIYEWNFEKYPEVGRPQDYGKLKGPVSILFEMGFAGDCAEFYDESNMVGNFSELPSENELKIYYIRVYKQIE